MLRPYKECLRKVKQARAYLEALGVNGALSCAGEVPVDRVRVFRGLQRRLRG